MTTEEPGTDPHSSPHSSPHASPHTGDATTGPHGTTEDHGADHGHDDHGHADEALGKIDLPAWGAGVLGVALGAVVVIVLAIASGALR